MSHGMSDPIPVPRVEANEDTTPAPVICKKDGCPATVPQELIDRAKNEVNQDLEFCSLGCANAHLAANPVAGAAGAGDSQGAEAAPADPDLTGTTIPPEAQG